MEPTWMESHMISVVTWQGSSTLWPQVLWALWSFRMRRKLLHRVRPPEMHRATAKAAWKDMAGSSAKALAKMTSMPKPRSIRLSSTKAGSQDLPFTLRPRKRPKVAATLATEIIRDGRLLHADPRHRPSEMKGEEHSRKTQMQQAKKATAVLPSNWLKRCSTYSLASPPSQRHCPALLAEGAAALARATQAMASSAPSTKPSARSRVKEATWPRLSAHAAIATATSGLMDSPKSSAPDAPSNMVERDAARFCAMPVQRPFSATRVKKMCSGASASWSMEAKAIPKPSITTKLAAHRVRRERTSI
mmetsp:Transcript_98757/g.235390  ORF Transcript_98757/g.235390 Transcript_98757/m.235390 type:complete len:304 (-) Transcript_98757:287-1198(-)